MKADVEFILQMLGEAQVKIRLLEMEVARLKDELSKKMEE